LYPQLFDPSPSPSSTYMQIGSRMAYDQTKLVYAGTLQKAPPARQNSTGSEELVETMEKMDVDSEAKEKKEEKKEEPVKKELDHETRKKHLELIKKLQDLVQEMLLGMDKEGQSESESKGKEDNEKMEDVKKENAVVETLVSIAAH